MSEKTVELKVRAGKKMSKEMVKAVNEAFPEGVNEAEDEEVEKTKNPDVKEVREMLNEIEEILEEIDESDEDKLSVPHKDYVDRLKMTLDQFVEREEDGDNGI
jgi:DNA primase large subunit